MSCYFRHMKDIFDELKIEVTKENKKNIDKILHSVVNIEYKDCSTAWKAIKAQIKGDEEAKTRFIEKIKEKFSQ